MEEQIPAHVAIVMDGNGRWAKKRLLPRGAGHLAGLKRMVALSEHAFSRGVKYLTLFALSTENLQRPKEELDGLFSLFREYFEKNVEKLVKKSIRLGVIGDMTLIPKDIADLIANGVEQTKEGTRGVLTLAIAYGARQEILTAVNRLVKGGQEVTAETFSRALYTEGLPDPDLFIRTGKECRLSNFLLYQCAYTELYFTDRMFPAFSNKDFDRALADYATRERRYGKV